MKKIFSLLLAATIFGFTGLQAQESDTTSLGKDIKKGAKKTGKAIGKGAKKVGNKTAEVASKGFSEVKDKTYKGKVGPDGQTIYIDKYSKYYWVDKKGVKQYVDAADLKSKND